MYWIYIYELLLTVYAYISTYQRTATQPNTTTTVTSECRWCFCGSNSCGAIRRRFPCQQQQQQRKQHNNGQWRGIRGRQWQPRHHFDHRLKRDAQGWSEDWRLQEESSREESIDSLIDWQFFSPVDIYCLVGTPDSQSRRVVWRDIPPLFCLSSSIVTALLVPGTPVIKVRTGSQFTLVTGRNLTFWKFYFWKIAKAVLFC